MDAPQDSNPFPYPFSNFEDSSVFNYMNGLSPIKLDKPVHHPQESSSLRFWSPPSVFTSPHFSCRKKECRILQSHSPLEAPKPYVSSEHGIQISSGEAALSYANQAHHNLGGLLENTDQGNSMRNVLVEQLSPKCTLDIPQTSIYGCGGSSGYDEAMSIVGLFRPVLENEGPIYDWESLIRNETYALGEGLMQTSLDPTITPVNFMPQFPQNTFRNLHIVDSPHEAVTRTEQMQNGLSNFVMMPSNLNERMDNEQISATHHSMVEHYIDFGMARMQRKNFDGGYNRKRRKSEPAVVGEGCKRCKCRSAKCLKLYCECFASSVYCMGACSCKNCSNKPINEDTVLLARQEIQSRNPHAFAPKVIKSADSLSETGVDPNIAPASTRHRRGCNCKKSRCQKKYCECYQNGVGCSHRCRCGGCKNAYGRNYSSSELRIGTETERKELCEVLMAEKVSQITETLNNEGHPDSAAPFPTPSWPCSKAMAPSLSGPSRRKPPSNFINPIDYGFHANQRPGKKVIVHGQPKFEYNFQSIPELEIPDIHQGGDGSSVTCINMMPSNVNLIPSFPFPNPYQ